MQRNVVCLLFCGLRVALEWRLGEPRRSVPSVDQEDTPLLFPSHSRDAIVPTVGFCTDTLPSRQTGEAVRVDWNINKLKTTHPTRNDPTVHNEGRSILPSPRLRKGP